MGNKRTLGFTIIEVMLVLAVTGALAVGVLATSTAGINNQRYIDAVNSLKALVQEEFINTTRVVNNRQDPDLCPLPGTSNLPVGASECVVMGRLITVENGQDVTTSNIIGAPPTPAPVVTTDLQAIAAYHPTIDTSQQDKSVLNWDTHIKNNESLTVMIFRSPLSGNIISSVKRDQALISSTSLRNFVASSQFATISTPQVICLDPSGLTVAQAQAIIINSYASGPSSVEQKVDSSC